MKRLFSNPLLPLFAGACLRLLFVFKYPAASGDTVLYEQFASNWVKLGKLAMDINGQPTPVDLRMPGYPAFLALISDQNLRSITIAGRPDQGMPDWRSAGAQPMTDQQVTDIVAWLASKRVATPGQPYPTHP